MAWIFPVAAGVACQEQIHIDNRVRRQSLAHFSEDVINAAGKKWDSRIYQGLDIRQVLIFCKSRKVPADILGLPGSGGDQDGVGSDRDQAVHGDKTFFFPGFK